MIKFIDGGLMSATIGEDSDASFRWQCIVAAQAAELLASARANGVILNINQQALEPLAMGHHVDVVTVYAARVMAEKGGAA